MASMTSEQWATGLIDALQKAGYKVDATPNNIANIQRMIGYESSGNQAGFMRDNNPWNLNTYTKDHTSLPCGKIVKEWGVNVQTFNTVADGYAAYVNQFKSNPSILNAFEMNAPADVFGAALSNSGWSSGHYANAATFATGTPFTGSSAEASLGQGGALNNQAATAPAVPVETAPPNYETQGMKTEYTGPGAYKGYDLSGVPGPLRGQAEAAINALASTPGLETKMLQDIFTEFPQDAWMTSITEDNTDII